MKRNWPVKQMVLRLLPIWKKYVKLGSNDTLNVKWIKECNGKYKIRKKQGIPGGSVLKNLPANAGDMGLILGPGRPHMPWSN